jgi:hypothetical protein
MDMQGYNLGVNHDKQNIHIYGSAEYVAGRSILTAEPEMLIYRYAGRGDAITKNGVWNNREWFEHTSVIGIWNSEDSTESFPTTRGTFHYSKNNGIHIVPARPVDYHKYGKGL